MNDADITTKIEKHDWSRFDTMTDAEVHEAAMQDPDAWPMSEGAFAQAKRVPRVKTLRRTLGLSRDEFATRYEIPLEMLSDWEEGRSEPDQIARAYLTVIASDPDGTRRASRLSFYSLLW
jgi:putative transcriptional regulator